MLYSGWLCYSREWFCLDDNMSSSLLVTPVLPKVHSNLGLLYCADVAFCEGYKLDQHTPRFKVNFLLSIWANQPIGVFSKWNRNSLNSGNLINHWSMNWAQFKDPVSHMCLDGAVVPSWSVTQEMAGWKVWVLLLYWQIFLSLNPANSVKTFRENSIILINHSISVLKAFD